MHTTLLVVGSTAGEGAFPREAFFDIAANPRGVLPSLANQCLHPMYAVSCGLSYVVSISMESHSFYVKWCGKRDIRGME